MSCYLLFWKINCETIPWIHLIGLISYIIFLIKVAIKTLGVYWKLEKSTTEEEKERFKKIGSAEELKELNKEELLEWLETRLITEKETQMFIEHKNKRRIL